VAALQDAKLEVHIPEFLAAWKELGSTSDGRAVITVYHAAANPEAPLNDEDIPEMAADPGWEDEVRTNFKGAACLPVLLAAARYYNAKEAWNKSNNSVKHGRRWW